jgi:AraC-like DNA-binding protein
MRISSLTDKVSARIFHPFETIAFKISRASLEAFALEEGIRRIANLSCAHGILDPTMFHLVRALFPAFLRPQEANTLFMDHVTLAACAHLIERYGDGVPSAASMAIGGLTLSQVNRTKEMLASNLKGNLLIADFARECGISRQHFIRAFKKTVGCTPHQWLQRKRVDQARSLLRYTAEPISEIALKCGFSDQSHLTRVFVGLAGTTPAVWRRLTSTKTVREGEVCRP